MAKTLDAIIFDFGGRAKTKLDNAAISGAPEDQLRAPLEGLIYDLGEFLGLPRKHIAAVGETSLADLKTRPDYAVTLNAALVGFIEVKAPGKGADPRRFADRHDREQWDKLQTLPNLVYTDGNAFSLWRNGELDEKTLDLWLFELSECEADELGDMLSQIDVGILGGLLRRRVEMDEEFKALFIEEGLVDPSTPGIDYADERAKAIMDAIWEADADLFVRVLYELFGLDREDEVGEELGGSLDRAKEEQEERVKERDKAAGIDITEAEILEKVDLDQLDLEDKAGSKVDEGSEDA